MFLIWILSAFLLFYNGINASYQTDPCQIYGSVYVVDNKNEADYYVYLEETEAFADLVVYKEENKLFADREGLWHFTDNKNFADFTVYYENSTSFADFSIAFTDAVSFAGCNN